MNTVTVRGLSRSSSSSLRCWWWLVCRVLVKPTGLRLTCSRTRGNVTIFWAQAPSWTAWGWESIKIIEWNWDHIDTMSAYHLFISVWPQTYFHLAKLFSLHMPPGYRFMETINTAALVMWPKAQILLVVRFFHQIVLKKWLEQINCVWMLIHLIICDEYYHAVNVPLP